MVWHRPYITVQLQFAVGISFSSRGCFLFIQQKSAPLAKKLPTGYRGDFDHGNCAMGLVATEIEPFPCAGYVDADSTVRLLEMEACINED